MTNKIITDFLDGKTPFELSEIYCKSMVEIYEVLKTINREDFKK